MYRLEGHQPVPTDQAGVGWARVRLTRAGPYRVSTVFLGYDHNFPHEGPPVLFETMTFHNIRPGDPLHPGGSVDNPCDGRSCTWNEAETIHQEAVDWLRENLCEPGDTVGELPEERITMEGGQ